MPNTEIVYVFTAKKCEYFIFINKHPDKHFKINKSRSGKINIKFGNKLLFKLLKIIIIKTLFG